jgi:hypothetical protein
VGLGSRYYEGILHGNLAASPVNNIAALLIPFDDAADVRAARARLSQRSRTELRSRRAGGAVCAASENCERTSGRLHGGMVMKRRACGRRSSCSWGSAGIVGAFSNCVSVGFPTHGGSRVDPAEP